MVDDDFADVTGELDVRIVGVVGDRVDALHVVVTIGADPIESLLATVAHVEPVRWEARATYPERICDLARDARGTAYTVSADGGLRVDGVRYALPARRGLACVWPVSPAELLVCGPGALGHVRLGPGRITVDMIDDDGPGEAAVVRSFGATATGALAVGTRGALWRKDDDGWTAHETPAREALTDLAWTAPDHAYVVGADGGLFAWDGAALRVLAHHDQPWRGCAYWRDALYLTSATAGLYRLDGHQLVSQKSLPLTTVRVVADQLVAWGGSLLVRYDGTTWSGGPLNLP